jgi:hypothetical protein
MPGIQIKSETLAEQGLNYDGWLKRKSQSYLEVLDVLRECKTIVGSL